ncbi:uncharacterized protein LOC129284875 [Prosopis cineraria]|uniref:uncharacterized protein LOC129284875 n=1 Tax=Prosopis cineraria TaxID=364024 RepID=UPI0024107284|nr:uncharacterized protein LOC129284875 [Prosopis cineraria]
MGTSHANKPPSNYFLAAENISPDSLSFSGLVSIQDHQSKSPSLPLNQSKHQDQNQTANQSPEFEFIVTKPIPKSAASENSVKKTKPKPANDLIISIEQLQPQAIPFQSDHTDLHHHTSSLSSLLSAHNHGNVKRVGSGNTRKFAGVEKGRKPRSKSSSGGKFFKSLVSPCRECRAFKPKVKVH